MHNGYFEYFGRIYVINLTTRPDRWDHIVKELERVGIHHYIRKEGVVINDGKTMRDREKSCFQSHIEIIQEAKDLDLNNVLILEDDTIWEDNFEAIMENALPFIKEVPWWTFALGGNLNNRINPKVSEAVMQVQFCYATHAYAVSRAGMDEVLKLANVDAAIDVALTMLQVQGHSYCLTPRIAYQMEGYSNIVNADRFYDFLREGNK